MTLNSLQSVATCRRQRGSSLIEVMVSLVIGLFVVGAVMVNYLSSGSSGRQQSAVSQMSEDAQLAFLLISRDLQMAGYTDVGNILSTGAGQTATFTRASVPYPVFGCANSFTSNTSGFGTATCVVGTTTLHSIQISYQTTTRTNLLTSANAPTDCVGNSTNGVTQSLPDLSTGSFTSNRYYVTTTAAITGTVARPELHCASPAAAASGGQPIAENVQAIKFWYGQGSGWTANDPSTRRPVRYVTADQVVSGGATWNDVVSVRICVLMRSAEPVLNSTDDANFTYTNCEGATGQTSADRRLYRAFYSTVALRNKVGF